eukprot:114435-Rhodomonas_salina.1
MWPLKIIGRHEVTTAAAMALSDAALHREQVFRELPLVLRDQETGARLEQGSVKYWEHVRCLVGDSISVEQRLLEHYLPSTRTHAAAVRGRDGQERACVVCAAQGAAHSADFQCAAQFRVNVLDM